MRNIIKNSDRDLIIHHNKNANYSRAFIFLTMVFTILSIDVSKYFILLAVFNGLGFISTTICYMGTILQLEIRNKRD